MAVTKKTTIYSYNGTDWDSIYLHTSADIVNLGSAITSAKNTTPYSVGTTYQASGTVADLLANIVNRLTAIDVDELPGIKNGSLITQYLASKITGTVAFDNLPANVKGDTITVLTEAEKAALTPDDVAIGDLVKVAGGSVYSVQAIDGSTITYVKLIDEGATTAWTKLTDIPTQFTHSASEAEDGSKYYATNTVLTGDLVDVSAGASDAGKAVKLDSAGKLNFSITGDAATLESHDAAYFATAQQAADINTAIGATGYASAEDEGYEEGDVIRSGIKGDVQTIQEFLAAIDASHITVGKLPLSVIPKGAIEKLKVVRNDTARFALTTDDVQNGDTVKVQEDADGNPAPKMYYVVDETKLDREDGYEIYTAGSASSIDWSGVLNTPTDLAGYGITDAVNSSEVVTTAASGKILKLDENGKLPTSITGDAATLGGNAPAYYATASALETLNAFVGHAASGQDPATGLVARIVALETTVGDASSGLVKNVAGLRADVGTAAAGDDPATGLFLEIVNLKAGTTITSIAASKLDGIVSRTNLPADVSGQIHTTYVTLAAALAGLTTETAHKGDLLKADGKVYILNAADPTVEANWVTIVDVSGSDIAWTQVKGTPTTLAGYGITDAVHNVNDVTDEAAGVNAAGAIGKFVKVNSDRKLHVDISGDAATLGGEQPSHYATQGDLDNVALGSLRVYNSIQDVSAAPVGQLVLILDS